MQQFVDLLSSKLMIERARNQRTFKLLEIRLNVPSTDPLDVDHYVATSRSEDIQNRSESFAENHNVLLRYLDRLYPKLHSPSQCRISMDFMMRMNIKVCAVHDLLNICVPFAI